MKLSFFLGVAVSVVTAACGGSESSPNDASSAAAGASAGGGSQAAGAAGAMAGGAPGAGGAGGSSEAGAAGAVAAAGAAGAGQTGGVPFDTVSGATVDADVAAQLVGVWAMKSRVAVKQTVPILGMMDSATTAWGLASIEADGDALVIKELGCHVEVDPSPSATTVIPDAVPQSVAPQPVPLHAWKDGPSVQFVRMPKAFGVGVTLADPETDTLPTKADDPRIVDTDKDGHPGVTVKVMGLASGDIYTVQRQKTAYYGALDGSGKLVGRAWDRSEQSVIGATTPLLNQQVKSSQDPDASKSTVTMVKVDSSYDCKKLIAEKQKLLP